MDELKNVSRVLNEFGESVREIYRYNLSSEGINSTDKLHDNVSVNVKIEGRFYEVRLTLEDYWKYIEYGRRPGKFPPIDEIRNWITVKPIMAREDDAGRIPSEKSLAFLIGRKIANEGIEGKEILQQSIEEVMEIYQTKISDALKQDIQDIIAYDIKSGFKSSGFKHIKFD